MAKQIEFEDDGGTPMWRDRQTAQRRQAAIDVTLQRRRWLRYIAHRLAWTAVICGAGAWIVMIFGLIGAYLLTR